MRTRWLIVFALAVAPLAQAQDDARRARVVETYRVADWPAPGPRRAGAAPERVEAKGYARGALRVDPRVGEGRVAFTSERGGQAALTLRVFDDARAARAALVASLTAAQGVLGREAGAGEVAFGARDAKGRLGLLLAVRGNVTLELRATRPGGLPHDALEVLALAADRAVQASPPVEPGVALPAPRVLAVRAATPARAGQPVRLVLELDPAGPPAAHAAFASNGGAGVLETLDGWELTAARAGPVQLEVWVVSKDLLVGRARAAIDVLPE